MKSTLVSCRVLTGQESVIIFRESPGLMSAIVLLAVVTVTLEITLERDSMLPVNST